MQPASFRIAVTLLALATLAHNQSGSCRILADAGLAHQLYFVKDSEYNATLVSYYAQDVSDIRPSCILHPETAHDVSTAIKALNQGGAEDIAIKSGGHSPYPNNNIEAGVTIDLVKLNSIKVKACRDSEPAVLIGTGAHWGDVYDYLQPYGLATPGAREGRVGAGGFLLGGGMSWFTARVGFSVDNIIAYELVLADGTIIKVSSKIKPDLFKALKGGMNNFRIVTKFLVKAFPQGEVFGGLSVHPMTRKMDVAENFVNMISRHNSAEGGFVTYTWAPSQPATVAYITANIDGDAQSPSFKDIPQMDPYLDTRAKQSLADLTNVIASTPGSYNIWYTLTFDSSMDMATKVIETFEALIADLQDELEEEVMIIVLMTTLGKTYARSGNVLKLDQTLQQDNIVFQGEALLPSTKHLGTC